MAHCVREHLDSLTQPSARCAPPPDWHELSHPGVLRAYLILAGCLIGDPHGDHLARMQAEAEATAFACWP